MLLHVVTWVLVPEQLDVLVQDLTSVDETGLEDVHNQGKQRGSDEKVGRDVSSRPMSGPGRGPLGSALLHYFTRWSSYGASCFKSAEQSIRSFWQVWVS